MSGNWSYPSPTGTPTTWLSGLLASLAGVINNLPGDNLRDNSVPRGKLAKQGAEAVQNVYLGNLGAASNAKIAKIGGPVADGGAVTRRVTYVSVGCNNNAAWTKGAGNQLKLSTGATYAGRTLKLTIDLNAVAWASGDEPYLVVAGFDWPSGTNLYFEYVYGGAAAAYNDTNVAVYYESPHVDPTT